MPNRLKTLLTQFSIRDLIWATVVAALVACLVRERALLSSRLADGRAAERANLQKQVDALEQQKELVKRQASAVMTAHEKVNEILQKQLRESEQLDPSYPIYYPSGGK